MSYYEWQGERNQKFVNFVEKCLFPEVMYNNICLT